MMKLFWKGGDVTQYVKDFTWSGSDTQASRTLEFSLVHSDYDKNMAAPDVKLGDVFTMYQDKTMLFYGRITSRERSSESGSIQYTARDYLHFLLRSTGTYKFENKKAEQIAKVVCADLDIDIDKLAPTKANISKLFFLNRPIYEIIMGAYTQAAKKDGKKYMPVMSGRKFSVIEKGKIIPGLELNQGENIIDSTYGETTDNMVNRVSVYNSENKKIGEVKNADWVKAYGVYQGSLSVESGNGDTEAKNALAGIEKTASMNCMGDVRCTAGKGIVIRDTLTGIKGKFWIQSDSHTWGEDGTYTMSLELAFKNVMETFEPDEEQEKEPEYSFNSVAGNRILNGQKVRAKFTAYFPDDSPMEGGYYDAYGVLLSDWTKQGVKVIAAPPSVARDTTIQVLETGTEKDGTEWRVRDRGGAIQIESGNVYHFDLLMSSAAECNNWGIRMGYAVIGNGTGYTTTGAAGGSPAAERATAQMEAWAKDDSHGYDQEYRWGERGDYDCSAAVIQAWENVGVLVKSRGAVSTHNMYDVFRACGFQDVTSSCNLGNGAGLQRGDVLLNHAHHTAMYCGNGTEVEASINENGGITGGRPGDQTGREFLIRSYRADYPWNCVLRYTG